RLRAHPRIPGARLAQVDPIAVDARDRALGDVPAADVEGVAAHRGDRPDVLLVRAIHLHALADPGQATHTAPPVPHVRTAGITLAPSLRPRRSASTVPSRDGDGCGVARPLVCRAPSGTGSHTPT